MRQTLILMAAAGAVFAWADNVHWRASRRGVEPARGHIGTEAIIVLGFRNHGTRANAINRYRVRAAARSRHRRARRSVLVLCGGPVAGPIPEADLMARYARETCRYTGPIRLDRTSTTTWENIRNAIPLIEDADTIMIVSNSLHAERGRRYLFRQRPDLSTRLVRAHEHRFGELAWVKPYAAVIGLRDRHTIGAGVHPRALWCRLPRVPHHDRALGGSS